MRHARTDYNRFQDLAEVLSRPEFADLDALLSTAAALLDEGEYPDHAKAVAIARDLFVRPGKVPLPEGCYPIGREEPAFLMRGMDGAMPEAVRGYGRLAKARGASGKLRDLCYDWADETEAWQKTNGIWVPTLPGEQRPSLTPD